MRFWSALLLSVLSGTAGADEGRGPTDPERSIIEAAVREKLHEKAAPELRGIRLGLDFDQLYACGEVNVTDAADGEPGFRKFIAMLIERDGAVVAAALVVVDGARTAAVRQTCAEMGI